MDAPKLSYLGRLQKASRLIRSAQFRADQKLAIRELCEALSELTEGLLEREQGTTPPPNGNPPAHSA